MESSHINLRPSIQVHHIRALPGYLVLSAPLFCLSFCLTTFPGFLLSSISRLYLLLFLKFLIINHIFCVKCDRIYFVYYIFPRYMHHLLSNSSGTVQVNVFPVVHFFLRPSVDFCPPAYYRVAHLKISLLRSIIATCSGIQKAIFIKTAPLA